MIVHDGAGPASFDERWDTFDIDYVWIAWDEMLRGSSISDSEWIVPTGWTVEAEQQDATVTDADGNEYDAANGALLSTTATTGRHKISNRVTLADGRQYERTVIVTVRQL